MSEVADYDYLTLPICRVYSISLWCRHFVYHLNPLCPVAPLASSAHAQYRYISYTVCILFHAHLCLGLHVRAICYFQNSKFFENQPYDEALEIGDAEDINSNPPTPPPIDQVAAEGSTVMCTIYLTVHGICSPGALMLIITHTFIW